MNLFAPAYLDFLPLAIARTRTADIPIRLAALCWLPYNRKPVVALGWLMAIFSFIPFRRVHHSSSSAPRACPPTAARQHAMNDLIRVSENKPFLTCTDDLSDPAKAAASSIHTLGSLPGQGNHSTPPHRQTTRQMVAMAEEVDRATKYVHFEFHITAYDEASAVLWDALFRSPRTRCTGARTPTTSAPAPVQETS